jgi:hypothetical protein
MATKLLYYLTSAAIGTREALAASSHLLFDLPADHKQRHKDAESDIVPSLEVRQGHQRVWQNKVVIVFEIQMNAKQVQDWLIPYSLKADYKLTYHNKLRHSMHVCKVDTFT